MSILHYQPTPNFKDTGRNVRHYVNEHMDAFWDIFKPLMPYIAICIFLDLVITKHFMSINPKTGEPYNFVLFGMIASYFLLCLSISWHRVIIHGPDNYVAMNPFKPSKREIGFIVMAISLTIAIIAFGALVGLITGLILPSLIGISSLAVGVLAAYMGCRLSFYFPAKATGNDITLKQAFALSEGYVLRLIFAPIFAMWKILLITLAYLFVGFLVFTTLGITAGTLIQSGPGAVVFKFIFAVPINLYFGPLIAIFGVTVLSNYYQHALQNPRKDEDDEHYI